ncbi:hypothetical protein CRV24_008980 [Beauveria bassiana]|nr:hypothetical protein CRV24_008980 [Beauveria bassiana]
MVDSERERQMPWTMLSVDASVHVHTSAALACLFSLYFASLLTSSLLLHIKMTTDRQLVLTSQVSRLSLAGFWRSGCPVLSRQYRACIQSHVTTSWRLHCLMTMHSDIGIHLPRVAHPKL